VPKRRSPRRHQAAAATLTSTVVTSSLAATGSRSSQPRWTVGDDTDRLLRLRLGGGSSSHLLRRQQTTTAVFEPTILPPPSFENRAQVDLIRLLAQRDLWRALDLILGYLEPADLCAVALVCQVPVPYIKSSLE